MRGMLRNFADEIKSAYIEHKINSSPTLTALFNELRSEARAVDALRVRQAQTEETVKKMLRVYEYGAEVSFLARFENKSAKEFFARCMAEENAFTEKAIAASTQKMIAHMRNLRKAEGPQH